MCRSILSSLDNFIRTMRQFAILISGRYLHLRLLSVVADEFSSSSGANYCKLGVLIDSSQLYCFEIYPYYAEKLIDMYQASQ